MSMTMAQWSNRRHDLRFHSEKFLFLRDLSPPGSMLIVNPSFSGWITSKYGISRQKPWSHQFPALLFLLGRHIPIMQRLLVSNRNLLPIHREYYKQNVLLNINLPPSSFLKHCLKIIKREESKDSSLAPAGRDVGSSRKITLTTSHEPRRGGMFVEGEKRMPIVVKQSRVHQKRTGYGVRNRVYPPLTPPRKEIGDFHLVPMLRVRMPSWTLRFQSLEQNFSMLHDVRYGMRNIPTGPSYADRENETGHFSAFSDIQHSPGPSQGGIWLPGMADVHSPLEGGQGDVAGYEKIEGTQRLPVMRSYVLLRGNKMVHTSWMLLHKPTSPIGHKMISSDHLSPEYQYPGSKFKQTKAHPETAKFAKQGALASFSFEPGALAQGFRMLTLHKPTSPIGHKRSSSDLISSNNQRSEIGAPTSQPAATFGVKSILSPVSDDRTPTLRYHTPLNTTLDDLKHSVASLEKKVAEEICAVEKSASNTSPSSRIPSERPDSMNIDLSHLTDQVYQLLERKISIERERRGLNG